MTWDEEFQIFSVNSDVDEGRSRDISSTGSLPAEISAGMITTSDPTGYKRLDCRLFLGDGFPFCIIGTWIRWYIE